MFLFFLHVTFVFLLLTSHVSSTPTEKHIFILAGQSNMAGRGGVRHSIWDGYVPPECHPNPLILRLNQKLQWEQAHEPLHADIDVNKTCGVGPGMVFANEVQAHVGLVGLVPCAVGGTKITQWERGAGLYMNMVNRANASMKEGGVIKGVLWYQGESDTVKEADADSYKINMERLVRDLRLDLRIPTLPIIQVAIASGGTLH
ncbi:hypothetical protein MRB53_012105 [Persea americana]|uniref:Uncharacterized protein n=1 Tax=Persea americana TaxID=3435 RepID=A0ACC2LWV9_PERAE|nr:hypothetical protein MRB53_012105 [Persea americana]